MKALVAKGADVNARNKFEQTPLHSAVSQFRGRAGQLPALKALLALGADTKAVSTAGYTALALAERDKKKTIFKLLR